MMIFFSFIIKLTYCLHLLSEYIYRSFCYKLLNQPLFMNILTKKCVANLLLRCILCHSRGSCYLDIY